MSICDITFLKNNESIIYTYLTGPIRHLGHKKKCLPLRFEFRDSTKTEFLDIRKQICN